MAGITAFEIGLNDDDAVDLPGDRSLHLFELLVVVLIGDRFHDLEAALLKLGLDDFYTSDPELGIESVKKDRDRLAFLRAYGHGHAGKRSESG